MNKHEFQQLFGEQKAILGMVHLPPLPGAPNYQGNLDGVIEHALRDAEILSRCGVSALVVENLGDYPYYPMTTEPETVAAMTRLALEIKHNFELPIGINVLRNSWKAAMAVAGISGAQFIRLNVLTDAVVTDQGLINGEAHLLMRYRKAIGADHVRVFADLYCKHGSPLTRRELAVVAHEMIERGMADVLIIDGPESARPPAVETLEVILDAAGDTPVIIGSGMTVDTVDHLRHVDGCVFGFGTKPSGNMNDPVDEQTVKTFVEKAHALN